MNRKYLDKAFSDHNLDVIISLSQQTRLWITQISTTDGIMFIEKDENHLFVDGRYIEAAQKSAQNSKVYLLNKENLHQFIKDHKFKTIGIEQEYITVGEFERVKQWYPEAKFVYLQAQQFRILKSDAEIAKIQSAVDISLKGLEFTLGQIKPGMLEKDLDIILNAQMKKLGADKESFDSIIATGANSAMPHYRTGKSIIRENDLLKIDFGSLYEGYCADITRTFMFKPSTPDAKKLEILQIVKEAAQIGRQTVRPGIKVSEVDKACRDYIASKGYGQYFVHSTGHGVGIDIHELPTVSLFSDSILEPGMVITVEPGIYIEGLGGARIEDVVLVTQDGSKTLSRPGEINGISK
ncbi:aminopeptidase P family protein [Mesomycoplasma conjunctivae]|uniref:aminopeptidase P family protein n=1 Tax=Mesomycoplasma conjunctivae TaxID=45361 RepID=UPI003DA3AD5E